MENHPLNSVFITQIYSPEKSDFGNACVESKIFLSATKGCVCLTGFENIFLYNRIFSKRSTIKLTHINLVSEKNQTKLKAKNSKWLKTKLVI